MLDKRRISWNFSRSAATYDQYAILQKAMADELLGKIKGLSPFKILDIGCGTGYLTMKMAALFPQAVVVGIDIAPGMIEMAKKRGLVNLIFMVGDGEELVFPDHSFDLIVSNATLQWMVADKALIEAKRLLRSRGNFVFNTFGPATLKELKEAGFAINQFRSLEELRQLAGELFSELQFSSRTAIEEFASTKDLMQQLKRIGANTSVLDRKVAKKDNLRKLLNRPINATFEIISGSMSA